MKSFPSKSPKLISCKSLLCCISIEFILDESDEDETILICAHAGTIRNILTYLISNTFEYHWNFKIDNGSVTILEVQDGFTVITAMNNTSFI